MYCYECLISTSQRYSCSYKSLAILLRTPFVVLLKDGTKTVTSQKAFLRMCKRILQDSSWLLDYLKKADNDHDDEYAVNVAKYDDVAQSIRDSSS